MEVTGVNTEHGILVELLKLSGDFDEIVEEYDFTMPYLNQKSYRDIMHSMHKYDLDAPIIKKMTNILSTYESILDNVYSNIR